MKILPKAYWIAHVTVTDNGGLTDTATTAANVNASPVEVARFEAGRATVRISPAVLNDHVRSVMRRFGIQGHGWIDR